MESQRKVREKICFHCNIFSQPNFQLLCFFNPLFFFFFVFFFSDEFTFFAVFDDAGFLSLSDVVGKLGSGIPNKTKFVVGRSRQPSISEALQVSGDFFSFALLAQILNKRWQTLDLVSMVQELRRRTHVTFLWSFAPSIQDTLSSLPRFKRAEDLS